MVNINLNGNKSYSFSDGILSTKSGDQILFITSSKLKENTVFSIPEGITTFNYALQNYSNIKKIIIPSTLETLKLSQGTFMPSSIEEIEVATGNETFVVEDKILYTKNDNKLILCFSKETDVVIKEGIKCFGAACFTTASKVKNVTIPDSAVTLDFMMFTNAPSTSVIIGKGVTNIDPMFKYMNRSGTVTISEENPNYMVEDNIIYTKDKKQLVTAVNTIKGSFTIPSSVEIIQNSAFYNQYSMTEVVIQNTLKEISGSAFAFCSGLKTITIPSSVEKIGGNCFGSCNNLDKIIINKTQNSISGAPWGATKGAKVVNWAG